ncbi:uncharacterized protein EDB93DRAFT_1250255 [Suillus bovinus]|uniref:uncharacterized protein n=1 Tax=Suillus bovinus TaxID=48563 RepID=UPI001B8649EB|nr:uncharacterized protein EDB93DRAFT_1250255 [Suillus bovinus]KAG2148188.1 hypothetical protein EDB93DRAFT_1250255 [Suillus bovinus]
MFTRISTAVFILLLNLMAVNAGIVPAVQAVGDIAKRSDAVGNYEEPSLYAEPVVRNKVSPAA